MILIFLLVDVNSTEYPRQPLMVNKWKSAKDIKNYLNKLQEYYIIVSRPR
jgi:hypothetical protein